MLITNVIKALLLIACGRGVKYFGEHVCPVQCLEDYTSKLHKIFCIFYLWLWLIPPLMTVQYVVYFQFCG